MPELSSAHHARTSRNKPSDPGDNRSRPAHRVLHTGLLGARLAFERPATADAPRIAILDIGGADHLMLVETNDPAPVRPDLLGRAGWGLRVSTYDELCTVREVLLSAGAQVGPIETLPTQWTMTAHDPDGRPVDLRAHRPTPPRTHD